jgi:MerR family redox-sensitive transcriptional activator SoxR
MDGLNIGQVAQQTGLHTSAIRYYESIGLVPEPERRSGWRRYEPEVLDRLSVIRTASELGFKLVEIRTLLDGFPLDTEPSERWQALAGQKLPEVREIIARATILQALLEAGLNCDCESIEVCISSLGESCRPAAAVEESSCGSCSGQDS